MIDGIFFRTRASTPGWRMRPPTGSAFTAENGAAQLGTAFHEVTCIRASRARPVKIEDATVAADYVTSLAGHYQAQAARPWHEVASDVQQPVQAAIDTNGEFRTAGDVAALPAGSAADMASIRIWPRIADDLQDTP